MRITQTLLLVALLAGFAGAQGVTANFFNQYFVDGPASNSLGMSSPIAASSITDAPVNMNVQAFNMSFPVVMLYDSAAVLGNTSIINAWNNFNLQIDLRDKGNDGYTNQILFSGYDTPNSETWTDNTGQLSATAMIPACTTVVSTTTCITNAALDTFEVGSQAIVFDPTNPPFNLRTTPSFQGTFVNGYEQFDLNDSGGEDFEIYDFKQGFTFRYYGIIYTQAYVSSNGFVSFGAADTSFPSISVNSVRTGVPRIMSFYNDLVPQGMPYPTTKVYAQQFKDATGLTKVKFVHDHLAEFSNQTGPHGGEIIVTDNDDIAVFVPGYNGTPSINTVVGITPGNSIDPNVSGFGPDLSALYGTNTVRGPGKSAFELYDHGPGTPQNPIDVIGFANVPAHPVGPGLVFLKNTNTSNTTPSNSSYIVQ